MVDFYFSYRSTYSYFILPRVINLKAQGIEINFKLVYPLAIRQPSFFKGKNFITYFFHKILDMRSVAKQQGMPFYIPKPDPIGEANGIIADAPAFSNLFAIKGSSLQ